MTRKIAVAAAVMVTMAVTMAGIAGVASAQSADSIIAQTIAARGGLDRLQAIQSEKLSGQIRLGPEAEGSIVIEFKRPNSMRMEMTILDSLIVQAYDGRAKMGWMINPFLQMRTPTAMSAEDTRNIAGEADFDGPFVDYARKGNQITFVKMDTLGTRPAYQLQVMLASGDTDTYYIDAQTHLALRWTGQRMLNGALTNRESDYTDYRPVDGVMFAFHITSFTRGNNQAQDLVFQTITLNADEPDTRFAKPDTTAR